LTGGGSHITVWDAATGREHNNIAVRDVTSLSLSADGSHLLRGGPDPKRSWIGVLDAVRGEEVRRAALAPGGEDPAGKRTYYVRVMGEVAALLVSPDGGTVAVVEEIETERHGPREGPPLRFQYRWRLHLWDLKDQEDPRCVTSAVTPVVAFSPDGKRLAFGAVNGTGLLDIPCIGVLDIPSGKVYRVTGGHAGLVTALAFLDGGKTLATGSADATILLWDVEKMKLDEKVAPGEPEPKGALADDGPPEGGAWVWLVLLIGGGTLLVVLVWWLARRVGVV
jgi:WD40 repeat protein